MILECKGIKYDTDLYNVESIICDEWIIEYKDNNEIDLLPLMNSKENCYPYIQICNNKFWLFKCNRECGFINGNEFNSLDSIMEWLHKNNIEKLT